MSNPKNFIYITMNDSGNDLTCNAGMARYNTNGCMTFKFGCTGDKSIPDQLLVIDRRSDTAVINCKSSTEMTINDKIHGVVSKYLTGDATELLSALVDELISVIDKRDALPIESLNLKGGLIAKHCSDGWRASVRQSTLKANGIEEGLESIISERVTKQIKKELLPGGLLHRSMWK